MTSYNEQKRRDAIDDAVESLLERQRREQADAGGYSSMSLTPAIQSASPQQIAAARRQVFADLDRQWRAKGMSQNSAAVKRRELINLRVQAHRSAQAKTSKLPTRKPSNAARPTKSNPRSALPGKSVETRVVDLQKSLMRSGVVDVAHVASLARRVASTPVGRSIQHGDVTITRTVDGFRASR